MGPHGVRRARPVDANEADALEPLGGGLGEEPDLAQSSVRGPGQQGVAEPAGETAAAVALRHGKAAEQPDLAVVLEADDAGEGASVASDEELAGVVGEILAGQSRRSEQRLDVRQVRVSRGLDAHGPHSTTAIAVRDVGWGAAAAGTGGSSRERTMTRRTIVDTAIALLLIAGSLVFSLLVIAMTLWLRRSVIQRLKSMELDLVAMESNADLTRVPVLKGRDEVAGVARALGGLVQRFEHFIGDIRAAAGALDQRSGSLDGGAERLLEASEQTRRQVSDVSQSMSAIAEQASAIERATRASADTVSGAVAANEEVQHRLGTSEAAAEHTVDVIGRVSDSIQALNESTGKIEQVIGVIADIAEQTNLLALNAAIEAARAGEHGRGFAVVADEVRTLSRRTSESTRDIGQWVQGLVTGVATVDSLLEDVRAAGNSNQEHLAALKAHLESLRGQFVNLEHLSTEISSAVVLQREEIGRVGRRSDVLEESSDFLIQSVEQTRSISEALRQESVSMRQLIARFRTASEPG